MIDDDRHSDVGCDAHIVFFLSPELCREPCKWVTGSLLPPTFAAERGNQELTEEKSKYQLRAKLGALGSVLLKFNLNSGLFLENIQGNNFVQGSWQNELT